MKDMNTMNSYLNEGFLQEQQKKYEQALLMFEKANDCFLRATRKKLDDEDPVLKILNIGEEF